ncbi:MAG: hypothetical protein WCQ20_13110 [Synechococcaceae cyanobacterium ELA739]|jgi:hypothetical protein
MRLTSLLPALACAALLWPALLHLAPAAAKVVAQGKPSPGGFYWQKNEKADGSIQYLCRSTKTSGIQKNAQCDGAKAVKP